MPEIGRTISHYRITGNPGKGDMGKAYFADDTTLDCKIGLKFLPDTFTADCERMTFYLGTR
ncbi:MAG: hypothetical protein P8Y80_17115 [Acidobacteriota bacterium]|jgi:hypothetical protein